jgi:uncharacterized membrane protein
MILALLVVEEFRTRGAKTWRFAGLSLAWLLFFPNAPYILTDITHLTTNLFHHFWIDLTLVLLCALTGLVLGFLSLFLLQTQVRKALGIWAGWLFIAAVMTLSGVGIYLGRFLRFNTWDVVVHPFALLRGIGAWAANPFAHSTSYAFPVLFSTLLFITYVLLYALTHLQPPRDCGHQIGITQRR